MKKLLLLLLCVPLLLFSQKKKGIALVIGNENYNEVSLKNPINDANLIAETLEYLGHDVVLHHDITTKSEMMKILKDFKSTGKGYDMVFIYYAGDGAQIYNANFLFPTKESFESEKDVVVNSISAQYILNYLKEMTDNLMIMMIDVNRNDSFKESREWTSFWGTKSKNGKKFLKSLDTLQPPNSLISFSTQSGGMSSHYYIRYEGGHLALEGSSEEYEKSRLDLYEKRLLEKNIIRDTNIFYVKEDGVKLFRDTILYKGNILNSTGNVRHILLEGQEVVLLSEEPFISWPDSWIRTIKYKNVYIREEQNKLENRRSGWISQGWISLESLIPYPLTFLTSDYSKILSKNIILWHNNSNLSLSEAFKNVRSEMRTITHNQQTPTLSNNLSSEDIFFSEDSDIEKSRVIDLIIVNEQKDNNISIDSSQYYALIIGVQDYENNNFPPLTNPINDAQELYNTLVDNYTFKENNIIFLKNPTRKEIINEFDDLSNLLNEDDNLLIFYAGHGGKWNRKNMTDGYWSPSNAVFEKSSTLINNNIIRDYLNARNILLISDACWAGSMMRSTEDNTNKTEVIQELYSTPSRYYMSSGQNTTVPDESIFIKYLIESLKDNQDRYLSATTLFYTINEPILFNTPRSNGNIVTPQFSYIPEVGHDGGDFIFIRKSQ
jgi:hypothetical protein